MGDPIRVWVLDPVEPMVRGVAWMLQQEDQVQVEETLWKPDQLEQLLIRRVPLPDVIVFGCVRGREIMEWPELSHLPVPVVVASEEMDRVAGWIHLLSGRAWALTVRGRASELLLALWTVSRGGCYISPAFADEIQQAIQTRLWERSPSVPTLTPMEKQVVMELVKDRTNQEIANVLGISRRTVDSHIASAIRKWEVNSRVGLAVRAVEEGWLLADRKVKKATIRKITV
ncbi:helix-turn-helix transcriptional regulator [Desmospora profundinema]|uniref:DNA-binding NarL/FixJ family response regulator n=1 Tax=Desmospora profundinema TaxID=1571184 RepID=A0ABU1IRW8_9BACL|nr:response regulator transcription factor [Desmospora profundinema]MDR6227539.1 DNA-binding NarL/FixJ family response regulator [Desmospora profundinema]